MCLCGYSITINVRLNGHLNIFKCCASAVIDFVHYFSTEFEAGYEILSFCFGEYSGVG